MPTLRINGVQLEQMLRNGLANLRLHEDEVNRLNVFPVADGDTGTNMYLTLANGLRYAPTTPEAGAYLKALSDGMLLGARGNSGVILSQFFRGFYQQLARCALLGPGELKNGLIRGYRVAYQSVVQPVEGTILSVTREGIEHIRSQIARSTPIETLLSMYIAEMRKTLSYTPEMLSVLKEAGVVDSGATGFIIIVEGMLKFLCGEVLDGQDAPAADTAAPAAPDLSLFDENSAFEDGYCMEFILQRMNGRRYDQRFRLERYIDALKGFGNSLVVAQDDKRVKVHIHTLEPARVIEASQRYGEFLTFKLENMQVQHNEHVRETRQTRPHKPLAVVSVVNGEGMTALFSGLGCDCMIDGGPTMNTSSQEFIEAFKTLDADEIVVLPNNPNVILAAQQAVAIYGAKNISVLPSESCAEGYFALAMDIADSRDAAQRIARMRNGLKNVATLSEATASRDYTYHELTCKKGQSIAVLNGEIVCVGPDDIRAVVGGMRKIPDIDDRETCVIFRGADVPEAREQELSDAISEAFPLMDAEFIDGGQQIYHWVLGIV